MRITQSHRPLVMLMISAILFVAVLMGRAAPSQPNNPFTNRPARIVNDTINSAAQPRLKEPDLATSIVSMQERLRQNPNDTAAYAQLGTLLLQRVRETADAGLYRQAEQALNEAIRRDPDQLDALIGQGALALSRHQFVEALVWAEHARIINPFRAQIFGVMADAQIELGRYDEAAKTLQTMIDLRPDIASYSRVSYLRELHGDSAGAIDAMRRAIDAGNPAAESTWWAMVHLGHLQLNAGDWASAEQSYTQALLYTPDYPFAHAGIARVRVAQGKTGDAIAIYKQLVERLPLPEFAIALGELYEQTGNPNAARQQYDIVRAIQALNAANGTDVDMEMVLFEADHGVDYNGVDYNNLMARARAVYQRRPSIYAADALAWVLYRSGNLTEARRYSAESLRLGSRDPLLLRHEKAMSLKP